ncbi:MAG: hypothetical protein K2X93_14095 [Candidatus Obscuribacterales bacterium]|nr:hypothetical protein [Candidatus Obscuribacterales bacterium]
MSNVYLPDLEIVGESGSSEKTKVNSSVVGDSRAARVALMNRFAELISSSNIKEEDFADRLMSNVFQQQFSEKLFDFLGGFVC